ncbi:hypothetical protein PUNSTDRAFT_66341 [Punctularia strigosozonata HHB-11173 SS5]|uniref:uncharacterized protein n=1 Tax=Punctularia strigosozonata (strain HHB-11173) TaxID=741275 RepID=UPI00044162F2|nr:uncharacterized protein PUNSTDRAFT_66341 [Punctularia strigosozonata HHB-11173 SS5]EIN09844.1 hypothetical protein PUNSTDRAFT_66341 [Punctularia strigosozonata HHB-11173 SS5]
MEEGEASTIPHPPEEDHPDQKRGKSSFPYTGWDGPIPSQAGGDREPDWMNKPPYKWDSKEFVPKFRSECWCGDVAFEINGDPLDAKHCHCRQCQRLHGAPFQWAVIFPKTSVRLVKNDHNALHCFSTEKRTGEHYVPCKVSCDNCRSPLFDEGRNTVLVYPSSIQFEDNKVPKNFMPTAHIFYSQR